MRVSSEELARRIREMNRNPQLRSVFSSLRLRPLLNRTVFLLSGQESIPLYYFNSIPVGWMMEIPGDIQTEECLMLSNSSRFNPLGLLPILWFLPLLLMPQLTAVSIMSQRHRQTKTQTAGGDRRTVARASRRTGQNGENSFPVFHFLLPAYVHKYPDRPSFLSRFLSFVQQHILCCFSIAVSLFGKR